MLVIDAELLHIYLWICCGNHSILPLAIAVVLFQKALRRSDEFAGKVIAPGKHVPEDERFTMRGIGRGKDHRKMIAQVVGVVKDRQT